MPDDPNKMEQLRQEVAEVKAQLAEVVKHTIPNSERRLEDRMDVLERSFKSELIQLNGYIHGRVHDINNSVQVAVNQINSVGLDLKAVLEKITELVIRLTKVETLATEREKQSDQQSDRKFSWTSALFVGMALAVVAGLATALFERLVGVK